MEPYYKYFIIIFPIIVVIIFILNKTFSTSKYYKSLRYTLKYSMDRLKNEEVLYKKKVRFGRQSGRINIFSVITIWGFASIRMSKSGILINPVDSKKFGLFYNDILKIEITDGYEVSKDKSKIDLFYNFDENNAIPLLVKTDDEFIPTLKKVCDCEILEFEQLYSGKDDWLLR